MRVAADMFPSRKEVEAHQYADATYRSQIAKRLQDLEDRIVALEKKVAEIEGKPS